MGTTLETFIGFMDFVDNYGLFCCGIPIGVCTVLSFKRIDEQNWLYIIYKRNRLMI